MTNEHDTVLYIGMTNDLAKRVSEHRAGEMAGFTANYRCKKLIYYEHCTDVLAANRAGKAAQELVAQEENGVDRNDELAVERPGARSPRR